MKNPEKTATLIMICIVALVAAYGLGLCINEIKASRTKAAQNKLLIKQIKEIESNSSNNTNQDTALANVQDRNTRTGFGRNTQDSNPRNSSNMMGRGMQMPGGTSMFGNSSAMGMRNNYQQGRTNNSALSDNQNTRKSVEEPNDYNVQGGR